MTSFPEPSTMPAVETREQLEVLLENIANAHREREQLRHALETDLAAVRQRYRAPLAELDHLLAVETSWAEAWARAHPDAFPGDGALECVHATIGFHAEPPRVERASRRWTWSRIAATLGELDWGRRYLRVPEPEVDRDALAADLASFSPEELRAAGMKVVRGDRFYLTPRPEMDSEAPWQEAA